MYKSMTSVSGFCNGKCYKLLPEDCFQGSVWSTGVKIGFEIRQIWVQIPGTYWLYDLG